MAGQDGAQASRGLGAQVGAQVGAQPAAVTVRLWAGAKAAAQTGELTVPVLEPVPLTWLCQEVLRLAPATERLSSVLAVCSVLVEEQPVSSTEPERVVVRPGETVDFLPPFAGG